MSEPTAEYIGRAIVTIGPDVVRVTIEDPTTSASRVIEIRGGVVSDEQTSPP